MQWIIKHVPSGKYICSKNIAVNNCIFARRFNSIKQAKVYINNGKFLKSQCIIVEFSEVDSDFKNNVFINRI